MAGGIGLHGADGNVGGHVAAVDGTIVAVSTHDAADVSVSGDACVGKGEVVDVGAVSCPTEDSFVVVGYAVAALVDANAADGLVITVEVAVEVAVVAVAADGGVVVLSALGVVPRGGMAVGDVVHHLEVRAFVCGASIYVGGQQVEVAGGLDLVRVLLGAATVPCPRRGGSEHHHKQQHRCPPCCAQPRGQRRENVFLNTHSYCLFLIIYLSRRV